MTTRLRAATHRTRRPAATAHIAGNLPAKDHHPNHDCLMIASRSLTEGLPEGGPHIDAMPARRTHVDGPPPLTSQGDLPAMDHHTNHDCLMIASRSLTVGLPEAPPHSDALLARHARIDRPHRSRRREKYSRATRPVQGRSGERLSGKRARARARACFRRVASWPSGLVGLSLPRHAPIPCQSVPGRGEIRSAIALCSPS